MRMVAREKAAAARGKGKGRMARQIDFQAAGR